MAPFRRRAQERPLSGQAVKKERVMKKVLCLTVFLAAFLFSADTLAGELKIVFADLQKALNVSDAGVAAKEKLKEEAQKLEEALDEEQRELQKLKDEIDKKSSVWNEETRTKKEEELKIGSQEFQKLYVQYGEELNKKKQESEDKIIDELTATVVELAEEKGYTFVLEWNIAGIIYGPDEADITDELIAAYNKKFKKE